MNKSTKKNCIASIDIGYNSMGLCVYDPCHPKRPYLEKSSMLITRLGKVYDEWSESLARELVYNWVYDRWNLFKDCKIVGIEKTINKYI